MQYDAFSCWYKFKQKSQCFLLTCAIQIVTNVMFYFLVQLSIQVLCLGYKRKGNFFKSGIKFAGFFFRPFRVNGDSYYLCLSAVVQYQADLMFRNLKNLSKKMATKYYEMKKTFIFSLSVSFYYYYFSNQQQI